MKFNELKEEIRNIIKERSVNSIRKAQDKNFKDIETALEYCTQCWLMTEEKTFTEIKRSESFKEDVMNRLLLKSNSHS